MAIQGVGAFVVEQPLASATVGIRRSQFVVQQRGGEGRSGVIAATAASTIHDTGLASG